MQNFLTNIFALIGAAVTFNFLVSRWLLKMEKAERVRVAKHEKAMRALAAAVSDRAPGAGGIMVNDEL